VNCRDLPKNPYNPIASIGRNCHSVKEDSSEKAYELSYSVSAIIMRSGTGEAVRLERILSKSKPVTPLMI